LNTNIINNNIDKNLSSRKSTNRISKSENNDKFKIIVIGASLSAISFVKNIDSKHYDVDVINIDN